jgi:hypothetical protein
MTQLQKKDAEIAELREKVALLEGLIEQVIRLHYPERWKALHHLLGSRNYWPGTPSERALGWVHANPVSNPIFFCSFS